MTEKLMNLCLKLYNVCYRMSHTFVPKHQKVSSHDVSVLQNFVTKHQNILVLTGAGISTESGLPDYRSEGVGLYIRSPNRPVQYKDFITNFKARKNYWARNYVAWNKFSSSQPNDTHLCLAEWERRGVLNYIVTQNVDRLHYKAGSERVIELHGTSYIVKCLNCGYRLSRYLLQKHLRELNPDFHVTSGEMRPDADIDLDPSLVDSFNVANCEKCNGILKPDVIFFGETVPKEIVLNVHSKVRESDAMLVLGSSLQFINFGLDETEFAELTHQDARPTEVAGPSSEGATIDPQVHARPGNGVGVALQISSGKPPAVNEYLNLTCKRLQVLCLQGYHGNHRCHSQKVFSGYRFVLAASEQGKPIGIVNIGPTRADTLASFKLSNRCGDLLTRVHL